MADRDDLAERQSTTRRELITYVIEQPASHRQRLPSDLNELLTLRESGRLAWEERPPTEHIRQTTV